MIFKLATKVDIGKMQDYLRFVQQQSKPFIKKNWGGWSITSTNGDIHDGWQSGELLFSDQTNKEELEEMKHFFRTTPFDKPTPIYNDYIASIVKEIEAELVQKKLSRLRITVLKPHPEEDSYWHKDSNKESCLRIHIPIITNELCFFDYENERAHLEADGSIYMVEVAKLHRAVNLSTVDRFHFLANTRNNDGTP